jgi:hypothetical protein
MMGVLLRISVRVSHTRTKIRSPMYEDNDVHQFSNI